MPCLIPEILFDIGKKLIEDVDFKAESGKIIDKEDVVIRFGLSGKEPFKAIKNVFITITTFEIYDNWCENQIAIGWGKQPCMLDVNAIPKCLLYSIGESVKKLFIEYEIKPILQAIIEKITVKKQLISFSTCNLTNRRIQFLSQFSTTLKHLTIPSSELLSEKLYGQIYPDSLVLNRPEDLLCSSIKQQQCRGFFSTIKKLTFNDKISRLRNYAAQYKNVIELFPSLETLKFNMKKRPMYRISSVYKDIDSLITIIKESTSFLSKVKYTVLHFSFIIRTSNVLDDFVRDDDVDTCFYYFRRTIESASSRKVIFEVLFPKNQNVALEYPVFDC